MSDEKWDRIFSKPPVLSLPDAPVLVRPLPRGGVTCAEHCSGRHEIEAVMACRRCGGQKYALVAHEYAHREGHFFYTHEPMNGAPPHEGRTPRCCGQDMVRT